MKGMAEKILIVDDDPETINFLRLVLGRQGYQLLEAVNGMQALKTAHSERPDLIVLDVMLPGMDGFEVARSLRNHPDTMTIPILMFTAKTQVDDKITGYESGVDIYLTKPVHPVELQANIKALIQQRKTVTKEREKKGYLVGVLSAKGGQGVSTVALNLAITYHQKQNSKVIAAELRPGHGSWAQELNISVANGLINLLRLSPQDITTSVVEGELTQTKYGIHLLLASNNSEEVEFSAAVGQLDAILQQFQLMAPLVVLDIGTNFLPGLDVVTNACDEIILVTETQHPAVKRTHLLANELRNKGFGSAKPMNIIIVNRTQADMSLSMTQVENIIGQSVALGFPPAVELAFRSSETSIPMILIQPEGIIAQQFNILADQIAHRVNLSK
jgi:DNA-binding response OmpR family regulator